MIPRTYREVELKTARCRGWLLGHSGHAWDGAMLDVLVAIKPCTGCDGEGLRDDGFDNRDTCKQCKGTGIESKKC